MKKEIIKFSSLESFLLSCKNNPVLFANTIFDRKPTPAQSEILGELPSNPRMAIKSGHGVGKSGLFPYIGYWTLFCRVPCKIVVTAPTKHQLTDITWPEFSILRRHMLKEFESQLSFADDRISLKGAENECFIIPRTARREVPEALQGLHGENIVLLMDEASGIHDDVFLVGESMLTTESTYLVAASNPTRRKGWFFDLFNKDKEHQSKYWKLKTISCYDSSLVDPSFIEYMKDKYGEDSDTFRVRVLGEFPETDSESYISEIIIRKAINNKLEAQPFYEIWGLDVARKGSNKTVLTRRAGRRLIEQRVWSKLDTVQVCGRVVNMYDEAKEFNNSPASICVDIIGTGSGVYDRLSELGLPVIGVHSGSESSYKDVHLNYRMDLWCAMKEWFEDCPSIPDDSDLVAQLSSVTTVFSSSGRMRMMSKDEMVSSSIESPDKADSLMLTFADRNILKEGILEEVQKEGKRKVWRSKEDRMYPNKGSWMSL